MPAGRHIVDYLVTTQEEMEVNKTLLSTECFLDEIVQEVLFDTINRTYCNVTVYHSQGA